MMHRTIVLAAMVASVAGSDAAVAQTIPLENIIGEGGVAERIIQLSVTITILSLVPGLLMIATSLPRFLIAFSFLRAGLGLQSTPSNVIVINLALFMTAFVMAPTLEKSWNEGVSPMIDKRIGYEEGMTKAVLPFRDFMVKHVREDDLRVFEKLAERRFGSRPTVDSPLMAQMRVLAPAFMISELRRGFEIGFLIVMPFLVIDLIVSIVVMSMGMMMMSPATFALPCKVIFFVLVDGWNILVNSMIRSYG